MDTTSLFTAALQLPDPWSVSGVEFREDADGRRELHITIGFRPGSRFHCPEAGCREEACPVHDVRERVWRHLNFFQYKAFIHAGVPRVSCPGHGVKAVPVPWARPGSGFTLLFEAMVVELAKSQPVADVAEQVGEHDTRLWRFIRHYVDEARLYEDYTDVEAIGIDETSRGGHNYITVAADLVERNVVCVVPGKDSATVKRFADDFMARNEANLTELQLETKRGLQRRRPRTARACRMRETLQDIYADSADRIEVEAGLRALCSWMMRSRLEPMKTLARQFRRHWDDILTCFDHRRTNAILEGLNSVIQNVKTRARGLQEHGLFQHDDLPDLRQTRPQHRHHLTRFTHTKQRKASSPLVRARFINDESTTA